MSRDQYGFTLIELLVVTILLGILMAIAVPIFAGHRGRVAQGVLVSDAKNVAASLETIYAQDRDYPSVLHDDADRYVEQIDFTLSPSVCLVDSLYTKNPDGSFVVVLTHEMAPDSVRWRSAAGSWERIARVDCD